MREAKEEQSWITEGLEVTSRRPRMGGRVRHHNPRSPPGVVRAVVELSERGASWVAVVEWLDRDEHGRWIKPHWRDPATLFGPFDFDAGLVREDDR